MAVIAGSLFEDFKSFDESEPLPSNCSEEHLKSYSKNGVPEKIKAFNKILKRIETGLNKKFKELNLSVSGFKLSTTFSADIKSRSVATKVNFVKGEEGKSNLNLNLNVNVNKLLVYPSFEIYSVVSALVLNSVLSGMKKEDAAKLESASSLEEESEVLLQKDSDVAKSNSDKIQYESSKRLIASYLKDFLPNYFGLAGEITNLDYVSELIAGELLNQMSESEISRVSSFFFKLESLNRKATNAGRKYFDTSNLYKARIAKVQENASAFSSAMTEADFAADKDYDYSNAKAINANQQFLALSSTFAGKQGAVKEALSGGFNNENQKLKDFCIAYANSFMRSNKLSPIEVRFTNSGNCEYVDQGSIQYININLSDPAIASGGGNITELSMALSHELTHAVDSTINKINGNINQDGTGLIGGMSEDLSACDEPKAEKLLSKVQAYCYQLNPIERHGRLGEISALKFLGEIYADDEEMKEQMRVRINAYTKYQLKTIHAAEKLDIVIKHYKNELGALGISSSSKAYQMIVERIEYLEQINSTIDVTAEKNSVDAAYEAVTSGQYKSSKSSNQSKEMTGIQEKE